MKQFLSVILVLSAAFGVKAQEDFTHHRAALSGTLTSSDTYSLEGSYHYMICRYLGIGGAIGYWSNYYDDGYASGNNWSVSDDDNTPSNLYLRPSLVLKSPGLNISSTVLSLYAEPGLMLNVPYQRVCIEQVTDWPIVEYHYVSTSNGQWLATELRAGISADIGPFGITAGYMMSSLDIYSQYRRLSYNGTSFRQYYPRKPFMQGAYLTLYCHF